MAVAMRGLRLKPKYEDLIGVAVSDQSCNITFPNVMPHFCEMGLF